MSMFCRLVFLEDVYAGADDAMARLSVMELSLCKTDNPLEACVVAGLHLASICIGNGVN